MNNTLVRTLSGAVYGALIFCCLLINGYLFAALIIFMMCTMMVEFYRMTMGESYKFSRALAILAGVVLFLLLFFARALGMPGKYVAITIIPVLIVMFNSLLVRDKSEFLKFAYIYTGLLYIAVPMALSNLLAFRDGVFSGTLILCFFIIIWCSDIGAFFIGSSLGQKFGRKIAPEISPKKSWVGFWGGFVFALLAALVLHWVGLLQIPVIHCLVLATLMHGAGVAGDLFESMWKRCCNVKDSGSIIPGHGGMLDRLDSTLMAMPLGAIYLALFNLI